MARKRQVKQEVVRRVPRIRRPPIPGSGNIPAPEVQRIAAKSRKLSTVRGVRYLCAETLTGLAETGDKTDPARARTIFYGSKILAELIVATVMEKKLRVLERHFGIEDVPPVIEGSPESEEQAVESGELENTDGADKPPSE